jgi:hypothetical protein
MSLAVLAAGCGSGAGPATNPSDPSNLDGDAAPVDISFRAVEGSAAALATTDGTGAAVDIASATVTIERIDLKLPDGLQCTTLDVTLPPFAVCDNDNDDPSDDSPSDDSDDDKIKLIGPFVVDLLTGESTPSLSGLTLPSGMVREVKVRLSRLSVAGTVTVDGTPTPFAIDTEADEEIEYEDLTGFEISEGVSVNEIVLSFDVTKWLAGVDMAACAADCSEFEDVIEENVEKSGTFSEDDHGDDDDGDDSEEDDDSGPGS